MTSPHAISVYTDGSVYNNPGPSGKGSVISYPDGEEKYICNMGYKNSSINRMELWACVEALRFLQNDPKANSFNHVCIYSDSAYVVDNHKNALYGIWADREWKTLDGNDIDNQDLWKDFIRECRKIKKRVELYKIKSHSGIPLNDKADSLAKESRKTPFKKDFKGDRGQVRRWLNIPNNKINIDNLNKINVTAFIQRTDPREDLYDAFIQVLRPKKYFGVRIKIRGSINNNPLRGAHIYKLELSKISENYFSINKIVEDLGKSKENQSLIKR